jgi:hypothetical protein
VPVAIVAALLWRRGIRAEQTTITNGGFVGFYVFLVSLLNPAAWAIYLSSFFFALMLNMFLFPLLGYFCGLVINNMFPNNRLVRTPETAHHVS